MRSRRHIGIRRQAAHAKTSNVAPSERMPAWVSGGIWVSATFEATWPIPQTKQQLDDEHDTFGVQMQASLGWGFGWAGHRRSLPSEFSPELSRIAPRLHTARQQGRCDEPRQ